MQDPRIVHSPARLLHGRNLQTSMRDGRSQIEVPAAWQRVLGERLLENLPKRREPQRLSVAYGAVWDFRPDDLSFNYLMGVEVLPGSAPQPGISALLLPEGEYAVFCSRVARSEAEFHAVIGECWAFALDDWLPRSGRRQRHAPSFEYYDERAEPALAERVIELWLPLAAA